MVLFVRLKDVVCAQNGTNTSSVVTSSQNIPYIFERKKTFATDKTAGFAGCDVRHLFEPHKQTHAMTDTTLLSAHNASQCDLHIVAGADGFSLAVRGADSNVLALRRWPFERNLSGDPQRTLADLRSALTREPMFAWPFRRVYWAWANPQLTLVPRRLFRAEDLPTYFKLLLHPAEYAYGYDELPEIECFAAYALNPDWVHLAEQFFPTVLQTHFAHALLRSWRPLARPDGYDVFLHLHERMAQVAVFDRQNLLFFNTFSFSHANDLLYFALLAYEQARLNPSETPLTICGNLLEDSEGWRTLYRYIRHLKFAELPSAHLLHEHNSALPPHCYWDVFSLKK